MLSQEATNAMSLSEAARNLDAGDPLARHRQCFVVDDPNLAYLDGNSLGRMTIAGRKAITDTAQQWAGHLVEGWGQGWYTKSLELGEKVGWLIGAKPGETLVTDSTSVNLFKLAIAALEQRPVGAIITDQSNFPSDLYILQGVCRLLGREADLLVVGGEEQLATELKAVEQVALLTLSHVCYRSGYMYDMAFWTAWAQERGGLVLWDLSHAVGSVPVELHASNADLAVGCTYKYLNGGPGAPAFLYVRSDLQDRLRSPIQGWFGQDAPFEFGTQYKPASGIRRFAAGTPPILALQAMEPTLDLMKEVGMGALRAKSLALSEFCIDAWRAHLRPLGVELATPVEASRRGSHVSFALSDAFAVDRCLIERHRVIPDFRAPDVIRFGLCPLYTTFGEVARGIEAMVETIAQKQFEAYRVQPSGVT